jgi:hypothetical protein
MRHRQAWTIPADEARTLLSLLHHKIASSAIEVGHRDLLIRLRSIIEEDLEAGAGLDHTPIPSASDHNEVAISDGDKPSALVRRRSRPEPRRHTLHPSK